MIPLPPLHAGLKQFSHGSRLSYLVFDPGSREAMVVDPHLSLIEDYRQFIADNRLRPVIAVDTHAHSDHCSCSHFFRTEFDATIGMSKHTESCRPSRKLASGDRIAVGGLSFMILETPGHSPDSISLFLGSPSGNELIFTGDTLLIGSSGGADPSGAEPRELWRSLRETLGRLPGTSLVLPSHDSNGLLFSTIAVEKRRNPQFLAKSPEDFLAMKKTAAERTAAAFAREMPEMKKCLAYNLALDPRDLETGEASSGVEAADARDLESVASINVQKYRHKLSEAGSASVLFIDVREPDEYQGARIPGTLNIPLSELGLRVSMLLSARKVYLSDLSGVRSVAAARTLDYVGVPNAVNVSGGLKAWQNAGFPVEKDG